MCLTILNINKCNCFDNKWTWYHKQTSKPRNVYTSRKDSAKTNRIACLLMETLNWDHSLMDNKWCSDNQQWCNRCIINNWLDNILLTINNNNSIINNKCSINNSNSHSFYIPLLNRFVNKLWSRLLLRCRIFLVMILKLIISWVRLSSSLLSISKIKPIRLSRY